MKIQKIQFKERVIPMKHLALRRVSAAAVTVVLLITTVFSLSIFAKAATFTPRLTAPAYSNKYFYNSDYNVFQKYGYGLPNCTAYAYGRAYEILGKEPKLSWNGAGQWYDYNRNNGYYKYGSTPKVGAIACWCYSGGGHVAVVEQIDSNGNMTLSNSEWGGRTFYLTYAHKNDYNPGGNSWWTFQGYIYLIDFADIVEPTKAEYKTGVYNVTDGPVNMRSGAGTGNSSVGLVPNGAKLSVTKVQASGGYTWGYTTYNKKNGWVALDFCTYVSALPAETTAPATVQPTTAKPTEQSTTAAPETTQEPRITPEPEEPVTRATQATQPTTKATQPATVAPTTVPVTQAPTVAPKTEPATEATQPVTKPAKKGLGTGDINSDGEINVVDATIIQKVLTGSLNLNSQQKSWCDFNFDGSVTIDDVTGIQKYISKTY